MELFDSEILFAQPFSKNVSFNNYVPVFYNNSYKYEAYHNIAYFLQRYMSLYQNNMYLFF